MNFDELDSQASALRAAACKAAVAPQPQRFARPIGDHAACPLHHGNEGEVVVGLEFGLDHEIHMAARQQHIGVAIAAEAAQIDGVARVLTVANEANANSIAQVLAPQVAGLATGYSHVLGPSTTFGKDLMPCVAALLGVAQVSDLITVEGEYTFTIDGQTYEGGPGTFVAVDAGTPHGFTNKTPGRIMLIWTPGGFEQFFKDWEEQGLEYGPELGALEADYGVSRP